MEICINGMKENTEIDIKSIVELLMTRPPHSPYHRTTQFVAS